MTKERDFISKKHLREIKKNVHKYATPITHMFDHIMQGLQLNYLKGMIKDYNPGEEEVLAKNIYDVLEVYKVFFQNTEMTLHELMNRKTVDHREALDILTSFSIAGEGTDILYERLTELIEPALKEGKYTIHDIELIINYLPVEIWENSKIGELIAKLVIDELDKFSTKDLLSFFQAYSNSQTIHKDLFNKMLNTFAKKIEGDKLTKEELFNFLEIYAIMIYRMNSKRDELNSTALLKIVSKHIDKKYQKQEMDFTLSEIAELYWIYGVIGIFEDPSYKDMARPLEAILDDTLGLYLAKHKPLTAADLYEGLKQELELNELDINAVKFYYETFGEAG